MLLLFCQSNLIAHFDRDSTLSDYEVILVCREETIRDSHLIQSDTITHSNPMNVPIALVMGSVTVCRNTLIDFGVGSSDAEWCGKILVKFG